MNLNEYDEDDPIPVGEWENVPALQKICWNSRSLATMIRCKLVIGEFTAAREYRISKANMRKVLALRQRNIGSDELIRFD